MTEFRKWREQVGLSYGKAAEMLGLTEQMVRYLDAGKSPRGVCVPQNDTRRLMTAIASKADVTPWPVEAA